MYVAYSYILHVHMYIHMYICVCSYVYVSEYVDISVDCYQYYADKSLSTLCCWCWFQAPSI